MTREKLGGRLTMNASEPLITVSSLEADGIVLLSSSHPDFERAFPSGRATQYDPLLPYTVVIRNDTDQDVIAYSVIWYLKGSDGFVARSLRTVFDFASRRSGNNFKPHSTEIVSFIHSLEAGGSYIDVPMTEAVSRLVELYAEQTSIRISLEAVLFADGGAVGPDNGGWIPRWQAWLEAEKHVFTSSIKTPDSQRRDVLRRLAEPGSEIARQRGAVENEQVIPLLVERSTDYLECLDLMKAYFALGLLRELDENRKPTMDNLRAILQTPYPDVHRK